MLKNNDFFLKISLPDEESGRKEKRALPFSVFSCSVSVSVRLEFALLERHELRPDLVLLRPHNLTACSGDMMPSVSVSGSEPTLTE